MPHLKYKRMLRSGKRLRIFVAVVAAFAWSYGPMFPASLCLANGGMSQEAASRAAVATEGCDRCDHESSGEHPVTPRSRRCSDAQTSCCLQVSADGAVTPATFELVAPQTPAVVWISTPDTVPVPLDSPTHPTLLPLPPLLLSTTTSVLKL